MTIDEGTAYADETEFGGTVLRFGHTPSPLDDNRTRIVHRLEISDDDAAQQIGSMITEDFPQAMDNLIAYADK